MKGRSDIPPLILGRLRPSKRLTSTQVLSLYAAMPGGTVQAINFSTSRWAEASVCMGDIIHSQKLVAYPLIYIHMDKLYNK